VESRDGILRKVQDAYHPPRRIDAAQGKPEASVSQEARVLNAPVTVLFRDAVSGVTLYAGELTDAAANYKKKEEFLAMLKEKEKGEKEVEERKEVSGHDLKEMILENASKQPEDAWKTRKKRGENRKPWRSLKQLRSFVAGMHNPYPRQRMSHKQYVLLKQLWTMNSYRWYSWNNGMSISDCTARMKANTTATRIPIASQALARDEMKPWMARKARESLNGQSIFRDDLSGMKAISRICVLH